MDCEAACIKASNSKHEALISLVDSSDESGSKINFEANLERIGHESIKISYSSEIVSSLSSSRSSSSEDLFQINPRLVIRPTAPTNIPKHPTKVTKPSLKNEHVDLASEALCRLEDSLNESPQSTMGFSDVTYECLVPPHLSPTQSPTVQTMERSGGFNPTRIPVSVFNRSPPSPMEWSVASNESLFSIHIGNNSFSRDFASRLGAEADLYRSEEPPRSGEFHPAEKPSGDSSELSKSKELYKHGDLIRPDEHIRPKQAVPTAKRVEPSIDEPIESIPKAHKENPIDTKKEEPKDPSVANKSDETKIIIHSVEFQKKKKSACPLCCCDCYRASCCCKWPSCSFKWSQCCCKWPTLSCKWLCCSGCSCKLFNCLSCSSCCKWPKCSCKWPSWLSCNFKCPAWSCFCCKCPMVELLV